MRTLYCAVCDDVGLIGFLVWR
uniref:Uncharacterized protein n=1 Tax=Arundo donax TaxID=35708 RepID=A0A0A9EAX9_ARUDO